VKLLSSPTQKFKAFDEFEGLTLTYLLLIVCTPANEGELDYLWDAFSWCYNISESLKENL